MLHRRFAAPVLVFLSLNALTQSFVLVQNAPSRRGSRRHNGISSPGISSGNSGGARSRSRTSIRSPLSRNAKASSPEDPMINAAGELQEVPFSINSSPNTYNTASSFEIEVGKSTHAFPGKWTGPLSILENPSLRTGRLLVLLAACIYGTNFSIVKILDDSMPLSISATLRFGLAAGVVAAIVLKKEDADVEPVVLKERNLAFWGGVEIGLWYCIGYIAQAEGLQTIEAGKSGFFNALAVIVVPILDFLLKKKVLKGVEVASVIIACVGVGLLELGPSGELTISSGDVLAFMQTIFFGVGYWRLESESQAYSQQSARLTVGQLAAVAFGSAIYAGTEMGFGHLDPNLGGHLIEWLMDPVIVGSLFWTGLISTALALYLETVALQVVSAAELTLLMTTTSLWAASFGFITLGEVLTPTGMVGGLLIMLGCVLGSLVPQPAAKPNLVHEDALPLRRSFELSESGRSVQSK